MKHAWGLQLKLKWLLIGSFAGLFLICLLPPVYGWLAGNIIGGLFAQVLANHPTLLGLTAQALGAGYTLLAVAGFDFLFLFMAYAAINTKFARNGTGKEIAGVAWRALKSLLVWQAIIAAAFLAFFGKNDTVYVYSLVPPFLTQSGLAGFYMMLWELSLFLFAFGYALTEDGIKAWLAGGLVAFNNFVILFGAAGVCVAITWLPGVCLERLPLAAWSLVLVGLGLHTLFFQGLLCLFLRQENVIACFTETNN